MDGPILETERLQLRLPRPDDFDSWARMVADPVAMRSHMISGVGSNVAEEAD
jgi:RimJ/RimL family protein N-acetyltransferase